jgi:ParB family transcriptional regulator, chromosome partitioning protein
MVSRKEQLKSFFEPAKAEAADGSSPDVQAAPLPKRAASGAVKAMGLSLGNLSQELEEARRLRGALAEGNQVASLDPAKIDPSPVADRLSGGHDGDKHFAALVESLRQSGQQVPVLVRPHPDAVKREAGWHQAAYGHRRIRAAARLGVTVNAIVRSLSDSELVLAQGKENADRRDLTFIERAFFAKSLLERGFDRATAQAALSVDKTEMSRLLQVADAMPFQIVRAIGPAPKAGRPRWMALGAILAGDAAQVKAEDEISSAAFEALDSNARFQRVFDRVSRRAPAHAPPLKVRSATGSVIAHVTRKGQGTLIEIPDGAGQGFADYLAAELPQLLAGFRASGQF